MGGGGGGGCAGFLKTEERPFFKPNIEKQHFQKRKLDLDIENRKAALFESAIQKLTCLKPNFEKRAFVIQKIVKPENIIWDHTHHV